MDWKEATRLMLLAGFPGGFFNTNDEFIAHKYTNTYFIFRDCESEEDVNCKILEWFSRPALCGGIYASEWRNKKFRKFILDGINQFLHTNFSERDIDEIYTCLGNRINHSKTLEFVRGGYDMSLLREERE